MRERTESFVENTRNDPRAEIRRRVGSTTKDGGKKWGRIERAKGISQSALWGSVNATLKSAYKSLRRRFPSARGVPIGLKLVRLTAFVPSRFFFVEFCRRPFVLVPCTFDSTWLEARVVFLQPLHFCDCESIQLSRILSLSLL